MQGKYITCKMALLPLALLLVTVFKLSGSEKIIMFHHMASYSHRVQTFALAEELAKKHEVSYISPYYPKEPNPNISELVTPEHAKIILEKIDASFDINLKVRGELLNMLDFIFDMSIDICTALYTSPDFKKWLVENPKADLVIIDNCFAECGVGLAYKLGAKYIFFSTVSVLAHEYDSIGFLPQASAIPEMETFIQKPPFGFVGRITNALESLKWRWEQYQKSKQMDELIRKELDVPEMPYIDDLLRNVSLIFSTGDLVTDFPRSLPPLYVNIAGIHAKKSTKPLPKEMEDFINGVTSKNASSVKDGDDGFIYISLGSMIVSSDLPQHMKDIFFDVVKSFPHIKFLWKWNGDFPKNIPDNLFLSKWFPQIDVLGHPKIRGFVTQCGRPSILEALFNGVPLLGFPIIGDQEINADRMQTMGAMVALDIANLNYKEFRDGVEKVLYDPNMKKTTKRLQKIFLDRPMTPLETASWYTEYVLRNEDTSHLRPAGNNQYWFVRRQIDVWATLSIGIFIVFVGVSTILWKVFKEYVVPSKKLKEN